MSCIHSYYITPNFVLICGKLHRYKTSFIHLYRCCVNPDNFVWARVRDRLQPYLRNQTRHNIYTTSTINNDFTIFSPIFIHVWKIEVLRHSTISLSWARVHRTTVTCLIVIRTSSCSKSFSESLLAFPTNTTSFWGSSYTSSDWSSRKGVLNLLGQNFSTCPYPWHKALGAGVGSWHALDCAFTLEISHWGRTVSIGLSWDCPEVALAPWLL